MTAGTRLAARQDVQAYAFLAPALILLVALLVYPLAQVIRMSFFEVTVREDRWVGLGNYAALGQNPAFWQAAWQTLLFTVGSVVAHLVIGLGLALLLHARIAPRLRRLFRGLLILPWLLAPVVAGMIWALVLNPFGVLNGFLTTVGLLDRNATINWLGDPRTSLLSVTLVNIWRSFPFPMVMLLAGLAAIPDELYEASSIDGCGPAGQFRYVTLPSLHGVLATVALLDLSGRSEPSTWSSS